MVSTYSIGNNKSAYKFDSAFAKHMNLSPDCLQNACSNVLSHFSVVAKAHLKCHLIVLKEIFISWLKLRS